MKILTENEINYFENLYKRLAMLDKLISYSYWRNMIRSWRIGRIRDDNEEVN
jgi:hypothetical protein